MHYGGADPATKRRAWCRTGDWKRRSSVTVSGGYCLCNRPQKRRKKGGEVLRDVFAYGERGSSADKKRETSAPIKDSSCFQGTIRGKRTGGEKKDYLRMAREGKSRALHEQKKGYMKRRVRMNHDDTDLTTTRIPREILMCIRRGTQLKEEHFCITDHGAPATEGLDQPKKIDGEKGVAGIGKHS